MPSAIAVPAAGSLAYDLYDIGVNQILLGPIGFVAGVAFMAIAAVLAVRQMIITGCWRCPGRCVFVASEHRRESIGSMIS